MNNLRNKVRKAILPKCEGCGGDYQDIICSITGLETQENPVFLADCICHRESLAKCKTCNGKGFVEELEHSIVCNENTFSTESCNCGAYKPLTLQEVLLALLNANGCRLLFYNETVYVLAKNNFQLPLTLPPEQYPQELQDKIMELL